MHLKQSDIQLIATYGGLVPPSHHAVIYKIMTDREIPWVDGTDAVLAFEVNDGCASLHGTITLPLAGAEARLEELSHALRIGIAEGPGLPSFRDR